MKAFALGTMLVLCGALAACSSSSSDGSGGSTGTGDGGGDEGGGSGDGGSTSTPTATSTTTTTTTGSPTTTTTTGGTCSVGAFFDEPVCDTCLNDNCCSEAEACIADFQAGGTDCVDAEGAFTDGPIADALFVCLDGACAEECGGGAGVCETGLSTQDAEVDACIDTNCCPEFVTCFGADGSNLEACNACLEAGGGPECDDYLACTDEAGCFGYQVCDSNLAVTEQEIATCLGDNCCDVTNACFGTTQEEFDDCIACLEAGSGPLCDDLIACDTTNACGLLTEG